MANDQLTNPQSSAQVTPPDNSSYAGATIPLVAPPTPEAPPTPTVPSAVNQPAAASPTTPATPAPPKTKQEWFQHLIKMSTPPQNVVTTDPTTGAQTVANKATPMSLAQLVITSALAGSFGTKDTYRNGSYGPILDRQASNADAFNKGQQIGKDYSEAAQKQQDDLQARKLSVVAANIQAAHNYAALTQAQFAAQKAGAEAETAQDAVLEKTAAQNQTTTLASADDYDHGLTDKNAPKARLAQGMTWDELMASPFKEKMTSQLMIQDGTRQVYDEHLGRTKLVPTYSVLNPDVKIKLNEDTVARMEKINPSFGNDLYKVSGGNVQLPLTQLVTLNHQATSVMHAEATLQSLADSTDALAKNLGITGDVEGKLAAAARGNKSVWKSLSEFENGQAHGGSTADQLKRLLQSDGGDAIFKALGTDRDKVTDYIEAYNNRIESARKLAEQGGMGEKAPAAPAQVNALVSSIKNNPNLEASDKTNLLADVPAADKDGNVHMAQGQVEKLTARLDSTVASNKSIAEKNALANGDPVQLAKSASAIIEGDPSALSQFTNGRSNVRENLKNTVRDMALARNLAPLDYTPEALDAKSKMWGDYNSNKKGSTGSQITSFGAFLGHSSAAWDATDNLRKSTLVYQGIPAVNTALKTLNKQFLNSPEWKAYQTSLQPVRQEISNFLAAGYKPSDDDQKNIDAILSDNETPERIQAAIRQLADTADIRLASMGRTYINTMNTTNPKLVSPEAASAMKKFGIQGRAPALSQKLPLGWQGGQATQMTDKNMAKTFVRAAGGDVTRAQELARANGWILE